MPEFAFTRPFWPLAPPVDEVVESRRLSAGVFCAFGDSDEFEEFILNFIKIFFGTSGRWLYQSGPAPAEAQSSSLDTVSYRSILIGILGMS